MPSPGFLSCLCIPYSESFLPTACALFFLSYTISFNTSKHRPVASLILSSQCIRGFPCLLCPATCPSIMSRSNDPFALITWPKEHNLNQRVVASSGLLGFTSSKTEMFILLSVHETHRILLHIHSSKASIFFYFSPSSSRFRVSLLGILWFLLF